MAERIRVQVCSGRRIRAQKQSGAGSFILLHVPAKVRFRFTVTTTVALPAGRLSRSSHPANPQRYGDSGGQGVRLIAKQLGVSPMTV
jgi:hypothetical protein